MELITIKDGIEYINLNKEKGVKCPCCEQLAKEYKYKLNKGMAIVLINWYKTGKEWVHPIKDLKTINGDYAKLRFWGLVEESYDRPEEDKKATGYWRITQKGKEFVNNRLTVQEKARIYDNRFFGLIGKEINIKQALGNKFNYSELMGDYLEPVINPNNKQSEINFQ